MPDVFLLDCHSRQSLAAIRALGRRGVTTTVASHRQLNPGRFSRYAGRFLQMPDPEADPERFLAAVEAELRAEDYRVLLPTNEETVELVVENRERFEAHAALPYPDFETLAVGLDKGRTIRAARTFDVPHPTTMLPDEVDLDAVGSVLGYPVVVKPQRGSGRDGVSVCETRSELASTYRQTTETYGPTQLQEFVPKGDERGVYTIYDRSSTLAGVTVQRRIRSKPPEGGASTVRETVADPALIGLADDLLSGLGWEGVAMAEFRIDSRDGEPKLLEINPRFWGSLALSVAAGVNFPHRLYRLAIGEPVPVDLTYDRGVRGRCLFTDLLQVHERDDTATAVVEFLRPSRKPTYHDVVSLQDPLPALGQVLLFGAALRQELAADRDGRVGAGASTPVRNDDEDVESAEVRR